MGLNYDEKSIHVSLFLFSTDYKSPTGFLLSILINVFYHGFTHKNV
jgi:hypothetical protein